MAMGMANEAMRIAPLELVLTPVSVLQLVALVQLALRHPAMPASSREGGQRFVDGAEEYFRKAEAPLLAGVVAQGNDPAFDVATRWRGPQS